jgi:phage gp36-like protein
MTVVVSYSTVENILTTLPNVQSRSNITSSDIAEFLSRGETIINAKLAKSYALPFTTPIPILETISTDIGAYLLLSRRFFAQEKTNSSPWPDRFKEAMGLLDEIAAGEMALVDANGNVIAASDNVMPVWSNTKNHHPTFYEDHVLNQILDRDKVLDNRDERGVYDSDYWGER